MICRPRIGYRFNEPALLRRALTHRSRSADNNERLEFLGDSVLGLVVSEVLFMRFADASEGDMTRMRAKLVCKESLASCARELSLQEGLLLGGGEIKRGDDSIAEAILADAFEAVVGAIYLDSDWATVKNVVLQVFESQLQEISRHNIKDDKTRLQELLQKRGLPLPVYEVVGQSGKPHKLTFTVACRTDDYEAVGDGDSRRVGEQNAARKMLILLENSP